MTQRLIAATGNEFNRQRLLEEVAVLVDRSDISEELERMTTHIGHFRELLTAGGEVGKKLDFLLQEMNREANTLLSKTGGVGGKGTRITELGPGHEGRDRKGPRTDSERGIAAVRSTSRYDDERDYRNVAGILFIISAPSGSGKSTLVSELRKQVSGVDFSISWTTRPPRGSEENGREYYFTTQRRV